MKRLSKANMGLIAVVLIGLGLSATVWAMEEDEATPRTDVAIELQSSDGDVFTVSRTTAELSGTIKNLLEDLGPKESIPLGADANTLKNIIAILEGVKEIAPRKIDNKQSPYKVQPVVDKALVTQSFDQIKNILSAANYLNIPSLINAVARALVYKDVAAVTERVRLLKLQASGGVISEEGEGKIAGFIPQFTELFECHRALKAAGITKEYSIADLIEEQPGQIKLTTGYLGSNILNLSNFALTSFDGIEKIDSEIKKTITALKLSGNQLMSIPTNAFQGLDKIEYLSLYNNQMTSILPDAFKGLNNLKGINLCDNHLTNIPTNAFQGLNNLQNLNLSFNLLTNIQPSAFQGLNNLKELELHGNQLISIQANAFQELKNLEKLFLSYNRLTEIPTNAFQGLNNLQKLWLSDNLLISIQHNAFQGPNNLQKLWLYNNPLSKDQKQIVCGVFERTEISF